MSATALRRYWLLWRLLPRKVVAHVRDRWTTVDLLSFMNDVVKPYSSGELHVVLDNLNIHKNALDVAKKMAAEATGKK